MSHSVINNIVVVIVYIWSKLKASREIGRSVRIRDGSKAVEELGSKGLLDENDMITRLKKCSRKAGNHQAKLRRSGQNVADEVMN